MYRFTLVMDIKMVTTTPRFTKHLFCVSLIRKSNKKQYNNNGNKTSYRAVSIIPKLHARAARITRRIPKRTNMQDSLNKANWKLLKYLYNRRLASFMFDVYKETTDPRLQNLFKPSRSRRSASNFEVIRPLKEIERDTLAFRGPALWNALPDGVKLSASKGIFKNNIKNGRTINDISFNKGTVFNTNKRKDYIYY